MRLLLALFCAVSLDARVILVSLDGMGYQALRHDPVARELTVLEEIAARGVTLPVTPHFPSTTANSHAALFTGLWGNRNGITFNTMPVEPRSAHTVFKRMNGFRSEGLRAEPIWVTAGRLGIPTVAVQVTQAFPFTPASTGVDLKAPPVVVNGYQTRLVEPHRVIRAKDTAPCGSGCYEWRAGTLELRGVIRGRSMVISRAAKSVEARLEPLETSLAKDRELARHFSDGLYLDNIPGSTDAVIYFRLFELTADDFLLYQSPVHELGVHSGKTPGAEIAKRVLTEAGGFIGNGPSSNVARGPYRLGPPVFKGGDGTAERRYMEVSELVTRQAIRHARWFFEHMPAELFIGYLPFPDEQEHNWLGLAAADARYNEYRRWTYAMVNRFAAAYAAVAKPGDHLVFLSDHGMAPVTHRVAINTALRDAGLLAATPAGEIIKERTKAVHVRNCILLNTADWKGGIVPLSGRKGLIAQVRQALTAIRHDGKAVIRRIYDSVEDAARFGYGADLCIDYLPGYEGSDSVTTPVVTTLSTPSGVHGFDPSRPDMKAMLVASGPRFRKARAAHKVQSIDIVPLVCELLGISVPAAVEGRVPVTLR